MIGIGTPRSQSRIPRPIAVSPWLRPNNLGRAYKFLDQQSRNWENDDAVFGTDEVWRIDSARRTH